MLALRRPIALFAALMLLAVVPAVAEVFKVHLKNGNAFETRYRPKLADWDETKIVILTDVGNRITLLKDDVVEITSDTELKGFGTVIDTTTIVLGWAPNDAPTAGAGEADPSAQWRDFLQQMSGSRNTFGVEQFVNVEDAGASGGAGAGLPAWEFGPGAAAGGSQSVVLAPPAAVAPPPQEGGTSDGGQQ
jgi:hypothetical protein